MRVTLMALALVVCASCGEEAAGRADAGEGRDGAPPISGFTCAEIGVRLQTRAAATSTACVTATDCLAVGYAVREDGVPTCNCGVAFAQSCGGDPVNAAAWRADPATTALEREWYGRCVPLGAASEAPTVCDCTFDTVSCDNGHCAASDFNCLGL